jgi:CubicO group peptidase (beta-lactamase class C family)
MARFGAAHSVHSAVSWLTTQSLARQLTPRTPPHSPVGVGLGWLVGRDWRLRRVVFNFGAGSGGRAFLALYPNEDVAVAVLGNLGHARMDLRRLIGIAAPFLSSSRAPTPEVASLFVGIGWVWWFRRRRRA